MRLAPIVQSLTEPLLSPLVSAITGASGSGFSPKSLFVSGEQGYVYDLNDSFAEKTAYRRNLLTTTDTLGGIRLGGGTKTNSTDFTSPSGGATVAKYVPVAGNTSAQIYTGGNASSISTQGTHTVSVYFRKQTGSYGTAESNISIIMGGNVISPAQTIYLLSSLTTASPNYIGNDWYRLTHTYSPSNPTHESFVAVSHINGATANGTDAFYFANAQVEVAATATEYQRVTDWNTELLAAFPQTTLYLDSAGTQPATVNGLVGLQLDKSGGLALGAELVTNGGFDTDSAWTKSAGVTITGGKAVFSGVASGAGLTQTTVAVSGKFYKVRVTISNWSSASLLCRLTSGSFVTVASGNGTFEALILAGGNNLQLYSSTAGGTFDIDNVSVKELPGNHRYQTTTGSKPILRGTPVGSNLVTNGDFATDTVWLKTGASAVTGGKGTLDGSGAAGLLYQNSILTQTKVYRLTFDIDAITGTLKIWDNSGATKASYTTTGRKVFYFTHDIASGAFLFRVDSGANTATVDNVEVVDVSADAVTAPYGLQYDGIDDFLTTASVDFTATDKMAVVMGVRKLSDAANGMFAMFGDLLASANGSMSLQAPGSGGTTRFQYSSRGTTDRAAFTTSATYNSPYTGVITGLSDISGDLVTIRVNGTQLDQKTTDQGTGNYGNFPFYFGRRMGTSEPYNGLDFGGVCIGKTLTATQLASVEKWVSLRTGAY